MINSKKLIKKIDYKIMRDVRLAVTILSYIKEHKVSLDDAFIELGLDKEISKKKWRRLRNDLSNYLDHQYETPLSRKLKVLHFLSENNKAYYDFRTFDRIPRMFEIKRRTYYSYIANFREEGFNISTRFGYYNGYKLLDQLKF